MNIQINNHHASTFFVSVLLLKGGNNNMKYNHVGIVKSPVVKVRSAMNSRGVQSNGTGINLAYEWREAEKTRQRITQSPARDTYG